MNTFDAIIGYRKTKEYLFERLSALQNPAPFKALGAHLPEGMLLYGRPGVGKTVLAQAFISESGRKSFAVSHTSGGETFLKELALKVEEARQNAPSILFLDDMDKYTDNDDARRAFVVLQAHIEPAFQNTAETSVALCDDQPSAMPIRGRDFKSHNLSFL